MTISVRKAVIPIAGLGTRLMPATRIVPKEMLPVVDTPIVQYAIDEAIEAGINQFVFITGHNKNIVKDYFTSKREFYLKLGRSEVAANVTQFEKRLPAKDKLRFVSQDKPYGLGHAVWCARELIGNEPFALLLPDVLIDARQSCTGQLIKSYNSVGGNVIAVAQTPTDQVSQYGMVGGNIDNPVTTDPLTFVITKMIEKPPVAQAPSNYRILGRYILQPEIMTTLNDQLSAAPQEIDLTAAMLALSSSQTFTAIETSGTSFDCGSISGLVNANIFFAMKRQDIAAQIIIQPDNKSHH